MPSSQLFAVNNSGRVFTLMTDGKAWEELEYLGIEFKKVSAHEMVVWALGGDHQIYVYVYGTTVPIRVCEEAYENQRWRPTEGFSHHLLPTDRPAFSSSDGLSERSLAAIHLPTLAWQWEGPWTIHTTLAGQQLPSEGWTYALDFPRTYSSASCWNSCVRRRRWVRYRRYIALNTWSAVPSIHQDYTKEPFIDISVGGGEVAGAEPDALMVWGVTALGKVMVREGVSSSSPEGVGWAHVSTPPQRDVTRISVGRSGAVWAVAWDGSALERTGLSREHPSGTGWAVVESPSLSPLQSVGVGVKVVWGVGRDHSVWFRRGVSGHKGATWLEMAGQRLLDVSVGPDDQVWGVTSGNYHIVARYGVVPSEASGQTWRMVDMPVLPHDPDAASHDLPPDDSSDEDSPALDMTPSASTGGGKDGTESLADLHSAMTAELCQLWEPHEDQESSTAGDLDDTPVLSSISGSLTHSTLSDGLPHLHHVLVNEAHPTQQASEAFDPPDASSGKTDSHLTDQLENLNAEVDALSIVSEKVTISTTADRTATECDEQFESATDGSGSDDEESDIYESTRDLCDGACLSMPLAKRKKRAKRKVKPKNVDEKSTVLDENAKMEAASLPYPVVPALASGHISAPPSLAAVVRTPSTRSRHPSSSSDSSHATLQQAAALGRRGATSDAFPSLEEHLWLGVSGGGCWVSPSHWPDWFSGAGAGLCGAEWKENICYQLYHLGCLLQPYRGVYREVVQSGSWTVTGRCRWLEGGHWLPATLYLTIPDTPAATPAPHHSPGGEGAGEGEEEGEGSADTEVAPCAGETSCPKEPVLVVEFTSKSKRKFSINMETILAMRVHVVPPSRCLVALYCSPHPQEPCCLQYSSEHTAEEWADYLAGALWQLRQANSAHSCHEPKQQQDDAEVARLPPENLTLVKFGVNSVPPCKLLSDALTSNFKVSAEIAGRQNLASQEAVDKQRWAQQRKFEELQNKPSERTIWATTADGAVFLHDSAVQPRRRCCAAEAAEHRLPLPAERQERLVLPLVAGFTEGCTLALTFTVDPDAVRFHVNLAVSSETNCTVALHCNPRIAKKVVVLNTFERGEWQEEERHKLPAFLPSTRNTLTIVCASDHYQLLVNGRAWHTFSQRVAAESVCQLHVGGDIRVTSVTYTHGRPAPDVLEECRWEGVGGHLVLVAGGAGGVVWGVSNDCRLYAYTGGRGGGPYKTVGSLTSAGLVHPQSDVVNEYLWENQRWNPVTGYSLRGLPTDRAAWTRYNSPTEPCTREEVRLPSTHWVWTNDWAVDYHPPAGCDSEGWQHATDFPLGFHPHCYVTDLVRRRRWRRKRRLTTSGPWLQLGRTLLVHADVASRPASDGTVPVWVVSLSGEILYRTGVTANCPEGTSWSIISTDHPAAHVCVDMGPPSDDDGSCSSPDDYSPATVIGGGRRLASANACQVWAVTRDGRALLRLGVTLTNPTGIQWVDVDAPGAPLKSVEVGGGSVWGLDQQGGLYRRAKTQPLFPEGTSWTSVCEGVEDISVAAGGDLWAVLTLPHITGEDAKDKGSSGATGKGVGMLCRRVGVTKRTPLGTAWQFAAGAGWGSICAKMMCGASCAKTLDESEE